MASWWRGCHVDRCGWLAVEAPPYHTGQGDNQAPVAAPLVSPPTVYCPGYQFNTFVIWPKQTHFPPVCHESTWGEWRYSSTCLTLAPDASVWSASHPGHFTPPPWVKSPLYPLNRRLVDPIVNLNAALEKRSSSFCQDSNSTSSSPQPGHSNDYATVAVTQGGSKVKF